MNMHKTVFKLSYEEIVSMDNLLEAWREFVKGKRSRHDVQVFEYSLMENLFIINESLISLTYKHSAYTAFTVSDPKTRHIHKATVADRVVHRALYRKLYPFFDCRFISDSFSCRNGKGSHKALKRFEVFARKASRNHKRTVWVLKCDIQKFFASIDQNMLLEIIKPFIADERIIWLIENILRSFSSSKHGKGLPLGNLTSQLFSNIYLNIFDKYVKHVLKEHFYIRYADDFIFISHDRRHLEQILPEIQNFLEHNLFLLLHPNKLELRTLASGIDFLGWVHFSHHRVLRTVTKRRMLSVLRRHSSDKTVASYRGLLKHGNGYNLLKIIDSILYASTLDSE